MTQSKTGNFQQDWEYLTLEEVKEMATTLPPISQFRIFGQWVDACQEMFPLVTLYHLTLVQKYMEARLLPNQRKAPYCVVFLGILRANNAKIVKVHWHMYGNQLPTNQQALDAFLQSSDSKTLKNVCVLNIFTNYY